MWPITALISFDQMKTGKYTTCTSGLDRFYLLWFYPIFEGQLWNWYFKSCQQPAIKDVNSLRFCVIEYFFAMDNSKTSMYIRTFIYIHSSMAISDGKVTSNHAFLPPLSVLWTWLAIVQKSCLNFRTLNLKSVIYLYHYNLNLFWIKKSVTKKSK